MPPEAPEDDSWAAAAMEKHTSVASRVRFMSADSGTARGPLPGARAGAVQSPAAASSGLHTCEARSAAPPAHAGQLPDATGPMDRRGTCTGDGHDLDQDRPSSGE